MWPHDLPGSIMAKCDNMAASNRTLKSERNRKTQKVRVSDGKCFSHSLEALETCSQPSSLFVGLPWESWLDALTGIIRDVSCMALVSLCPPLCPWASWSQNTFLFLFLELFVLWRNDGFTFTSCQSGFATITQVFLREGLKSEAVILPTVFHTLPRQDSGSPAPCSVQWPQEHTVPAFPRENSSVEYSQVRGSRGHFIRLNIFCCFSGNICDRWHQKPLFSLDLVGEQTAPAVMGFWLVHGGLRGIAGCGKAVVCAVNYISSWVAHRVWEGREPAQALGNRPLVMPGRSPRKTSRYTSLRSQTQILYLKTERVV